MVLYQIFNERQQIQIMAVEYWSFIGDQEDSASKKQILGSYSCIAFLSNDVIFPICPNSILYRIPYKLLKLKRKQKFTLKIRPYNNQ